MTARRRRLPAPRKSHNGVMLASLAAGSAATVTQLYRDKDRRQDRDPACHFDRADSGREEDNLRVLDDARRQVYTKVGELTALLSK